MSSYSEYFKRSTSPVSRREIPGPATVLIIELDEPLHAVGAAEDGMPSQVSTFIASPGRGPAST